MAIQRPVGATLLLLVARDFASFSWASSGVWVANTRVEGFPHLIDIASPSSGSDGRPQPAAALVFLHGGGGTKEGVEAAGTGETAGGAGGSSLPLL